MIDKIFIFGASNTQSMWWTWKDFLEIESDIVINDLSRKGVGNTYMINSLIDQSFDENSLIIGMLTNVDKFDWYVEGEKYHHLCSEKHPPIAVGPNSGFWCTGSWFPLEKQYYLEHFYNLDYFAAQTVQQICLLKYLAAQRACKLEIYFDSPIWSYTEQDLNQMVISDQNIPSRRLLDLPLTKKWSKLLDSNEINHYDSSLIGYCWKKKLPWANNFYKGHPPSSSQWQFYQEVVRPRLSKYLNLSPAKNIESKITKMDVIWQSC